MAGVPRRLEALRGRELFADRVVGKLRNAVDVWSTCLHSAMPDRETLHPRDAYQIGIRIQHDQFMPDTKLGQEGICRRDLHAPAATLVS